MRAEMICCFVIVVTPGDTASPHVTIYTLIERIAQHKNTLIEHIFAPRKAPAVNRG